MLVSEHSHRTIEARAIKRTTSDTSVRTATKFHHVVEFCSLSPPLFEDAPCTTGSSSCTCITGTSFGLKLGTRILPDRSAEKFGVGIRAVDSTLDTRAKSISAGKKVRCMWVEFTNITDFSSRVSTFHQIRRVYWVRALAAHGRTSAVRLHGPSTPRAISIDDHSPG